MVAILLLAGLYVSRPDDPHRATLSDIEFEEPPDIGPGPGDNGTGPDENLPPLVDAGKAIQAIANTPVTFEGIAIDPDGNVTTYRWDFDGDGAVDSTDRDSGKAQWTYGRSGTFNATLTVTDDDGATGTDHVQVRVRSPPANLEPIAFAGEDAEAVAGDEVEFYMTGNDFDGSVVLYEWDYDGDGTFDAESELPRITYHTFNVPGNYTAVLRVTDDQGASTTDERTVTIKEGAPNKPPMAYAGPDVEVEAGSTVVLAGTGSDPDGLVVAYRWDLDGDGTIDWTGSEDGQAETVYDEPGTYAAVFSVVDDDGEVSSDVMEVTVVPRRVNRPPVANTGVDGVLEVTVGEQVAFGGFGTDPDGTVVLYEWDFDGDGTIDWTSSRPPVTSWTYDEAGTFVALFRVTDDEGATGEDHVTVEVDDDEPGDDFWPSNGKISIGSLGTFTFDPNEVRTVRPDIFTENHFSLFDVLVHLDERGEIELEYHFDESMNTHVIDKIEGLGNWWYWAYYHGGWQETNNFRMDHYPYKDKMVIHVQREDGNRINGIHRSFKDEVERLEDNDGKVIIPKVIIRGRTKTLTFTNVEVTAHDLRNDTFQEGVITAIDVILSLHDAGLISSYKLTWYETIGQSEILNYFVDGINSDVAYGTCGFVYEEGSEKLRYGNHIHIPSDYRVLNSPDYEEWFWICL